MSFLIKCYFNLRIAIERKKVKRKKVKRTKVKRKKVKRKKELKSLQVLFEFYPEKDSTANHPNRSGKRVPQTYRIYKKLSL